MPRQRSLLADIVAAFTSYPPCPDLCRCRIFTLPLPLGLGLAPLLSVLFLLGAVGGMALFGVLFEVHVLLPVLGLTVAGLGVFAWLRAVVWDAQWERAHPSHASHTSHLPSHSSPHSALSNSDAHSGSCPDSRLGRSVPGSQLATWAPPDPSDSPRTRVKVPTTLGLLATDVLRAAAQVGATLYAALWLRLPLWAWAGALAVPAAFCALLWHHWRQCEVLS